MFLCIFFAYYTGYYIFLAAMPLVAPGDNLGGEGVSRPLELIDGYINIILLLYNE